MNLHSKALESIFDDLDDLETKRIMSPEQSAGNGFSVTITMNPDQDNDTQEEMTDSSEHGDFKGLKSNESMEQMNKGGMAGYAQGGEVMPTPMQDDMALPPFLRKKKK